MNKEILQKYNWTMDMSYNRQGYAHKDSKSNFFCYNNCHRFVSCLQTLVWFPVFFPLSSQVPIVFFFFFTSTISLVVCFFRADDCAILFLWATSVHYYCANGNGNGNNSFSCCLNIFLVVKHVSHTLTHSPTSTCICVQFACDIQILAVMFLFVF